MRAYVDVRVAPGLSLSLPPSPLSRSLELTNARVRAGCGQVQSTLFGEQNAGQFSWGKPAASNGMLWVQEPVFGTILSDVAKLETGRLFGYALGAEFPRNGTVAEPASASARVCILGDAPKGRFGATIAELPGSNVLAVASPQSYLRSRLSGAVYPIRQ